MTRNSEYRALLAGILTIVLILAFAGCDEKKEAESDSSSVAFEISATSTVAFTNVTVIPMTSDVALPGQTVVVRDGLVYDIGPTESVSIPNDSVLIDGTDRYLMPGLADMHIHPLCGSEDESCYIATKEVEVYLAHGVTSVLSMQDSSGTSRNLVKDKLADPIKQGTLAGPSIYTASFAGGSNDLPGVIHSSQIVSTEQDGRNHVLNSKAQNYDFIKVYDGVSADAFEGIVAQAKIEGMGVIGHFPQADSERMLSDGLNMVAHAGAYFWGYFNLVADSELVASATALTATNQVYVNTTLGLDKKRVDLACANEEAFEELLNTPEIRYANVVELGIWRSFLYRITNFPGCTPELMAHNYNFIQQYTKAFYDAGVILVLGTDSPLVWGVPGHSAHEELQAVADLGLSPYETLSIATRNAGKFINDFLPQRQNFGTIEIGQRADLLLVKDNPLTDVSNAQKQIGVMARGRWFSAENLNNRLDKVANEYAAMQQQ